MYDQLNGPFRNRIVSDNVFSNYLIACIIVYFLIRKLKRKQPYLFPVDKWEGTMDFAVVLAGRLHITFYTIFKVQRNLFIRASGIQQFYGVI